MNLKDFEINQVMVVYPGRFQPFHHGHKMVYDWLVERFDIVTIATSGKVELPDSPFSFSEKKLMMVAAGVDSDHIARVVSPYRAVEISEKFNPNSTAMVYAISQKDMDENPRFKYSAKADGSPSYFIPFDPENLKPLIDHAHILVVPTFDFQVAGADVTSATEVRKMFIDADTTEEINIIQDLYGEYNERIHDIFIRKMNAVDAVTEAINLASRPRPPKRIINQTINNNMLEYVNTHTSSDHFNDLMKSIGIFGKSQQLKMLDEDVAVITAINQNLTESVTDSLLYEIKKICHADTNLVILLLDHKKYTNGTVFKKMGFEKYNTTAFGDTLYMLRF